MKEKSLTTKHIAEYCQVTQRTAVQWINENKLKFFRTPGKHIRVYRDDFVEFLNKYQIPLPEELASMASGSGRKKILIVDDDKSMVDAIIRLLHREGKYILETAFNGFEAGQKFAECKPDMVILDLRMPGIDGHEVCTKIRDNSKNSDVKILAISGTASQKEIELIMSLGADDYLSKPFTNKELKTKVVNLFDWDRTAKDKKLKDTAHKTNLTKLLLKTKE